MRTAPAAKKLTLVHGHRSLMGPAGLRRGAIETALEVEFRCVENLLRSMDNLAFYWTRRHGR
ncbi:MAG TPA: hypothetical protein VKK31_09120 [Thermoanaerobaculia bacterium]|nr:hypothetical protein [Thermoanaerobaculia bacterium]